MEQKINCHFVNDSKYVEFKHGLTKGDEALTHYGADYVREYKIPAWSLLRRQYFGS